ncbi:MAG: 2-haloalkanoic acid dehalogenase [uncultured Nocardioidaceae bacterium]|uniref:2-haloalkanoic acid dehalogenase n=1 Tax=uncultured Nocardioidaceae bacterium TaxID=253824 RepID=A0A6J4LZ52_9ACTN|nr:MAG: 2-haloalkanoic acid dehalogenase [uncultured Nocardioidaceae bacterium]
MSILVLDVNETLSDMAPLGGVLERHGVPAGLAATWFASVLRDGFALSVHREAPPFAELGGQVLRRLLVHHPSTSDPDQVVEEVLATMQRLDVHPDVVDGLRALAADGHRLVTFTNGSAAGAEGLLERAGVRDLVDRSLSVEGLGVWKPHSEAYTHAVRVLGGKAADLTLVAVHPWDIDGASRAGLRTAYVDRSGAPWPEVFRAPGHWVRSFSELPATLRATSR